MIPKSLRVWFVVHFCVDMLTGVPLLVAPVAFLSALGWTTVDPLTARLVGAALMGIGIESYLGRNAGVEAFRGMLNLKIIWSGTAVLGLAATAAVGDGPWTVWLVVALFVAFNVLWIRYRLRLRAGSSTPTGTDGSSPPSAKAGLQPS